MTTPGGGSPRKLAEMRGHPLALVLIPVAVVAGTIAFILLLEHLPSITGVTVYLFLGSYGLLLVALIVVFAYRSRHQRPEATRALFREYKPGYLVAESLISGTAVVLLVAGGFLPSGFLILPPVVVALAVAGDVFVWRRLRPPFRLDRYSLAVVPRHVVDT